MSYSRGHHHHGDPGSNRTSLEEGEETVPAISLNRILGDRPIDILKIDCEGAEWEILADLPTRPRVICREWHEFAGVGCNEEKLRTLLPDYVIEVTARNSGVCGVFRGIRV